MKPSRPLGQACLLCARGLGTLALWILWLALTLLLAFQLYIVTRRELAVPDFLLRRAERQIADAGFRVSFARTTFDPDGRVLLEDVRLSLPEYAEPILAARAIYVALNPWALAIGTFDPREVRIIDASATIPAMLSASGRDYAIVSDLHATLRPADKEVAIAQFTARIAGIPVSAHGVIPPLRRARIEPETPLAEIVSMQFPRWSRQAAALAEQLQAFEAPALEIEFTPAHGRGAVAAATLLARSLTLNTPLAAQAHGLRIVTRVSLVDLTPTASAFELGADELRLPLQATARDVRAVLAGGFRPGGYEFVPRELNVAAGAVEAFGFTATAVSAQLLPQPLPQLDAVLSARVLGAPLAVRGRADFAQRTATLQFNGAVSPDALAPIDDRVPADLRRFFAFEALDVETGELQLGPGWKFRKLGTRVSLRGVNARGVTLERAGATLEVGPHRLHAPEAHARIGENFARGSYEQDLRTRQFRFLLDGQLRPLAISGWFRDWWERFFRQFEFPAAPPVASVDVQGVWRDRWRTSVFVAADADRPVVRGGAFDRVRTRLFVRPGFVDAHELLASAGPGLARGTFAHFADPVTRRWQRFDIDLVSTVPLQLAAKVTPPVVTELLGQFEFARPPTVKLTGRFDSADAPGGAHQQAQVEAGSEGGFRFKGFPLEDVSFTAVVRDDEIVLDHIAGRLGGGAASGRAQIRGAGPARRVGFDMTVKGASLGQAAAALQEFTAARQHRPPEPPGKYVKEKASVRLDLAAAAEGFYSDPFSFQGNGNASLEGDDIGEIALLGALSDLLRFTALRFTTARGSFKIDGAQLAFSELHVRGPSAAIDAHGEYRLDRQQLDFNARLFPFQESGNLLKSVVGVVLTPFSNVFEVKLTGSLEKPQWAFVIGPTNLLRSLSPEGTDSLPPGTSPLLTPPPASPPPPPAATPQPPPSPQS